MAMEILLSVVLLFVGIAVLVMIHICIVGRAFRTGYENGASSVQRMSSTPITKLTVEDLQMIPCFEFDHGAGEKGVECAVCLESFQGGDKCRVLPNCTHSFHSQCIDSWLLKTPVCPICRTTINPPPPSASPRSCREANRVVSGEIVAELT